MKYETINDAAHAWVAEFNAIPMAIIDKLLEGILTSSMKSHRLRLVIVCLYSTRPLMKTPEKS